MSQTPPTHRSPPTSPVFDFNHGAPPVQSHALLARSGNLLVVGPGAVLPDRCIKCNQPTDSYRKRLNLWWHHPALFLLILAGLLIYAIVALCVRKKAVVDVPFCQTHRTRRSRGILIGWLICALVIPSIWAAAQFNNPIFAICALVTFFGGLCTAAICSQIVTPDRIEDRGIAWLKGVSPAFLDELPELRR